MRDKGKRKYKSVKSFEIVVTDWQQNIKICPIFYLSYSLKKVKEKQ